MDKPIKSDEDFLRDHLKSVGLNQAEDTGKIQQVNNAASTNNVSGRNTDLQYLTFDVKEFPCGMFYAPGTIFKIRAAAVKEIQSYSMVDDNLYDIVDKMNDMLMNCVRIQYADGTFGTYLDIRDPDRFYLVFTIRELTFQSGNNLVSPAVCNCGNELNIDLIRRNFVFHQTDEKLMDYFDATEGCFVFQTTNGNVFKLAPPKIGLQKAFTEYIVSENAAKKKINLSFLKNIPFMLYDRNTITTAGIVAKVTEYGNMDDESFQFLNEVVGMLKYGISGLVTKCGCGSEVHSEMIFPNRASDLFLVSNAFDKFIKK